MTADTANHELTPALEDYIETVYELVRDKGVARIRDIAKARSVKAGSVSPAMKRLAGLGLVRYEKREFIELTQDGVAVASRVYARHEMLSRFFEEVLLVPSEVAVKDACSMEHILSDTSLDRLVRMFEFIHCCPEGQNEFLERFHKCPIFTHSSKSCDHHCTKTKDGKAHGPVRKKRLTTLKLGRRGVVSRIDSDERTRSKLFNLGLLPLTEIEMDRCDAKRAVRILVNRYPVQLTMDEAYCVLLQQTSARSVERD